MKDNDKALPSLMYSHTNGQPQNALPNYGALGSMPPNQVTAPGQQMGVRGPGLSQPVPTPNGRRKICFGC